MPVARWVKEMTEEIIGGPTVEIGGRYVHPEDGVIEIVNGQFWGEYGLSNHWYWKVERTGEIKNGYAQQWAKVNEGKGGGK